MLKPVLRHTSRTTRQSLPAESRALWSQEAGVKLFTLIEGLDKPLIIAGYFPIGDELDIRPALMALAGHHTLALPAILPDSKVLSFKRYMPGDALIPGPYGISMPPQEAQEVIPKVIITPLLAFDRGGHRLGYGGGYYDATLSSFGHENHVLAIGVAFSAQEVDVIPAEPHDQRLHVVITEKEIIRTL